MNLGDILELTIESKASNIVYKYQINIEWLEKMLIFLKNFLRRIKMRNFLKGYGSVLNLFPSDPPPKIIVTTHAKQDRQQTDQEALRKDWEAIGKDMWSAIDDYSHNSKK